MVLHFLTTVAEYVNARDRRRAQRAAAPQLDARPILYGAVVEFIVRRCLAARNSNAADPIAAIHAEWLMTSRDDLGVRSPRDIMLIKHDFIDFDLQSRELQWGLVGEPAPGLAQDSVAYRYAGFGTHELVLYYDLIRLLLSECWKRVSRQGDIAVTDEVARLAQIRADWFKLPQDDLGGYSPAFLLESERARMPLLVPAEETYADDDCPLCLSMREESGPTFMHLDACNMDDDFPFSFHCTRGEWEEERCRQQESFDEFRG